MLKNCFIIFVNIVFFVTGCSSDSNLVLLDLIFDHIIGHYVLDDVGYNVEHAFAQVISAKGKRDGSEELRRLNNPNVLTLLFFQRVGIELRNKCIAAIDIDKRDER